MKHERNALQADVFPKLEQLCLKNGFQFQAIDLRWGVSSEAGLDHRTMRICFDELRRTQEISPEPNFLVLLGDRYGWRPLPEMISAMEFEELKTAASKATTSSADGKPISEPSLDPLSVLNAWYRCDENMVLPETPETAPDRVTLNYTLQSRTQSLDDGRDYTHRKDDPKADTQDWLDVQEMLWSLINKAFPANSQWLEGVDWVRHVAEVNDPQHPKHAIPQIARFQASATEQEVWCGALSARNAESHVIACFREISNRDDFSAAEAKEFFDVVEGRFDQAPARCLSNLKEAIRLRLGDNKPFNITFTRLKRENGKVFLDASESDTQTFCDAVYEKFRPIIEHQIEEYWNKSVKDSPARTARELEIEHREYERFAQERGGVESFVGRKDELQAILNYVGNESRWPLVIHGASGCGKTALLARASQEVAKTRKRIERFIGVTPRASDLRSLLNSLCQELRPQNPNPDALPTEIKELCDEFSQHLHAATSEQPLILFLDAFDQLADADSGRSLHWIPLGQLPSNVKLIVSCLSDRPKDDPASLPWIELQARPIPAENHINLDALSEPEANGLLFDRWLRQVRRNVNLDQRTQIEQRLSSPSCRQPIFLKLLFEEVQLWHSYDPPPVLGKSVSALLRQLFDRLSLPTNHDPLLVNRVLGYLSASRHGLAENEILEILFADPEYRDMLNEVTEQTRQELPAKAKRIPIALWSRLRFDLTAHLTERAAPGANVMTFYHRQVAEWVLERFTKSSDQGWQPHNRLVDYFHGQADPEKDQSWKCDNPRPLSELPYHIVHAARWGLLDKILADPVFCEARIRHGNPFELMSDCQYSLKFHISSAVSVTKQAITAGLKALLDRPDLCLQTLTNRFASIAPDDRVVQPGIERAIHILDERGLWVQADSPYPLMNTTDGLVPYQTEGMAQCLSEDQKYIVVLGKDHCLRIFDLEKGSSFENRKLPEVTGQITSVLVMAPSNQLVWLDSEGILRCEKSKQLFHVRPGENRLSYLRGHGVVAINKLEELVTWNLENGHTNVYAKNISTQVKTLRTDGKRFLLCVAGKKPQRILVFSVNPQIEMKLDIPWFEEQIVDADVTEDGKTVFLLCRDRSLRRINVTDGRQIGKSFRYEQGKPTAIWGAPLRCAIGLQSSSGWVFLATQAGQIGAWNWQSDEMRRLPDWNTEQQNTINLFTCHNKSGNLVVGLSSEARVFTQFSKRKVDQQHQAPVSACTITDQGQVISMSSYDGSLCWFTACPGLHLHMRQSHPGLTAVSTIPNSNDVLLGNNRGWCWRQSPERKVDREEVYCLFDKEVTAITSHAICNFVATDANGRMMLVGPEGGEPKLFRGDSIWPRRQISLQSTDINTLFSFQEIYERGNRTVRLTLVEGINREREVLRDNGLCNFVLATKNSGVCVFLDSTRFVKFDRNMKAKTLYQCHTAVEYVGLLGEGRIAVMRMDGTWLEIWDLVSGFPIVAAADIPGEITCFATHRNLIVVGFRSGALLKLRVRGSLNHFE
jgi:hypothetical protein